MFGESVLQLIAINALLALSIYLTLACGQLSLANAAFMGIGAYVSATLTLKAGWPFWAVLVAAVVVPMLVAALVGLPTLRLRGVFLAIATIGCASVYRGRRRLRPTRVVAAPPDMRGGGSPGHRRGGGLG